MCVHIDVDREFTQIIELHGTATAPIDRAFAASEDGGVPAHPAELEAARSAAAADPATIYEVMNRDRWTGRQFVTADDPSESVSARRAVS